MRTHSISRSWNAIIASIALLSTILFFPDTARQIGVPMAPQIAVAQSIENCDADGVKFTGQSVNHVPDTMDGVRATIDPSGYFNICSGITVDSVSAWISLEPGIGNPYSSNGFSLVQIGIIQCDSPIFTPCDGQATAPTFFYAVGGPDCGGATGGAPTPHAVPGIDVAGWGPHAFIIARSANLDFQLYVDGINRVTIADTDIRISCWSNEEIEAGWWGERTNSGNSLGNDFGLNALKFSGTQYNYLNNATWFNSNIPSCRSDDDPDGTGSSLCQFGSSWMNMYSTSTWP